MTVGGKIRDLIEEMLTTAQITSASPGWVNHVFTVETDPGLIGQIDSELSKTGGAVAGRPKTQDQIDKRFRQFMERNETEGTTTPTKGGLNELLKSQLGTQGAKNAMLLLSNPKKAIATHVMSKNFLRGDTVLGMGSKGFGNLTAGSMLKAGGILAAVWMLLNSRPFIEKLTEFFTQRGGIFDKTLRLRSNTLQNQFRSREQQESIQSGFTQVIMTTNAGTTNPRDSYNTYYETVHNESGLTNLRNIRSVGNVTP